jgi:16S rRNA (guanine527-N7)-methyltransferase
MGLPLPEDIRQRLLAYLQLLAKWNKTYNLTAVRDPQQMVVRHLLDSLAVLPWLDGARLVDVGSGAGLPGIPIAIARPDLAVTLLDANAKRTRFLTQAVAELKLGRVEIVQSRVEEYRPSIPYDVVISRAFAALNDFLSGSRHLCAPGGRFLAMKGVAPTAELATLPSGFRLVSVETLRVPALDESRTLVIVAPQETGA